MTSINISLSESMKVFIEEQAAQGGYSSASEYLQQLILQDQQRKSQEHLEEHLNQLNDDEFEAVADQLADEFAACIGSNVPVLSDYAVSREGIYEDHP